jgi:hypothetical protein
MDGFEHRPDEREAARFAGEPADHLRAPADLAQRSLKQVRRPPRLAVPQRVAQMHDERVEVVGEAAGGGLIASVVELADQHLWAQRAVFHAGCFVERVPVGEADS